MKATAKAHPIQGLIKYHGMRDEELRLPYHDSISVCTAPSHTKTTAEFDPDRSADEYVVEVNGSTTGAQSASGASSTTSESALGSITGFASSHATISRRISGSAPPRPDLRPPRSR